MTHSGHRADECDDAHLGPLSSLVQHDRKVPKDVIMDKLHWFSRGKTQMGPAEFRLGDSMDVRPHPHIGLTTVTYLFDGEIIHRDSLGTVLPIRPGELNWMTAGRGIAHSERTPLELRSLGSKLFGIQSWVALSPSSVDKRGPALT
jgi:redox-sensitive bicupin YhaK (pirin superfamily)